ARGDLTFITLEGDHRAASCRLLLRDHLDEPGHERQTFPVIRRELWIGRLTKARHITDHRDRTVPVVTALQSPRRDRRVVYRSIEREVELHIPLQPIDDRAGAADSQVRRK